MRTKIESERFYQGLDKGIRFAVRVLHANGIDTCQSCQGGKGHSYPEPTVDLPINTADYEIFGALSALSDYGLPVCSVGLVWRVQKSGLITEKLGRITFFKTMEDRTDETPNFIWGYVAK
jgi:hypothetical protein